MKCGQAYHKKYVNFLVFAGSCEVFVIGGYMSSRVVMLRVSDNREVASWSDGPVLPFMLQWASVVECDTDIILTGGVSRIEGGNNKQEDLSISLTLSSIYEPGRKDRNYFAHGTTISHSGSMTRCLWVLGLAKVPPCPAWR